MAHNRFPLGWDEARVRRVIAHYEGQSDAEAAAEDAAAFKNKRAVVEVPAELLPVIRGLIDLWPHPSETPTKRKTAGAKAKSKTGPAA